MTEVLTHKGQDISFGEAKGHPGAWQEIEEKTRDFITSPDYFALLQGNGGRGFVSLTAGEKGAPFLAVAAYGYAPAEPGGFGEIEVHFSSADSRTKRYRTPIEFIAALIERRGFESRMRELYIVKRVKGSKDKLAITLKRGVDGKVVRLEKIISGKILSNNGTNGHHK